MRLKRITKQVHDFLKKNFQYQKGAIKTSLTKGRRGARESFQYQKGAIKTRVVVVEDGEVTDDPFNTKKVRLKRTYATFPQKIDYFFQYQKGAIKTESFDYRRGELTVDFQYQKGAIKTDSEFERVVLNSYFQYQKGAIKTPSGFG